MVTVLDCTLRDGGYYNKWDFEPLVVRNYLDAMANSRINYIELGLRSFARNDFLGGFAYTTESFLNRLDLPEGPIYGVMVDAKTLLNAGMSVEDAIDALFIDAKDSKVQLVRVAAHLGEVELSEPIVKALKAKGYLVGYNLMQAGGKSTDEIASKAKLASEWGVLDVLYFADSLGNMDGGEVRRIVAALRQHWKGSLGIHTHNNMAKALDNTLVALDCGVEWLDVTVTGMGRGAGNAQTERLLAVLSQESERYAPAPVFELAIRDFEPMQKNYGWGSNLLYFLGAQNEVHPTYIQNLLSDTHYGTNEIVGAVEYLSKLENTSSYKGEVFKAALSFNAREKPLSGTTALLGLAEGKEVVILANGPSLSKYQEDIKAYIEARDAVVIAINILPISAELIDYYCISHNTKFLSEHDRYRQLQKPLILPKHRFSEDENRIFIGDNELLDYGIEVKSGLFHAGETTCAVPYDVTACYSLAVAQVMGASLVSLIGFDGYESHDPRHLEMIEVFTLVKELFQIPAIRSLTPTSYPLEQGSIYAPI